MQSSGSPVLALRVVGLVSLTCLLGPSAHAATTLYVGPSEAYTTIASAVAASLAGDTIILRAGRYAEDLDLRGRTLTIEGESGPARTVIAAPSTVWLNGTITVEGVSFSPAPATGVYVDGGNVTLDDVQVHDAPQNGLSVVGGVANITETAVFSSGKHNFAITYGTATITRSLSWYPVEDGFLLQAPAVVRNSVAIGGAGNGFRVQSATATLTNVVALNLTYAAVNAFYPVTVTNAAFLDDTYIGACSGADPTFDHGVGTRNYADTGCSDAPHTALTNADPAFSAWSDRLAIAYIDLHPAVGSPMIDAGLGVDADGSAADLGVFGGPDGTWSDHDGDGQVTIFDCDDFDPTTFVGAGEIVDGRDNDCDGSIDEDPVDTGGGDTGDTADSGDTGQDRGTGADLDADGWRESLDCDEHNVATHPGAVEIIDHADNNCDGATDEGTIYGDDDHDGYTEVTGDCDDHDPERNPAAADDVYNALDNDCDGQEDTPHAVDHDGDGYRDDEGDCDDGDPAVHPGAIDGLDGADSDCDGVTDDDAITVDLDGDGVTPLAGDCQDENAAVHAGAVDIADNFVDEDCSGSDNYDADRDGDPSMAAGGTDCDDLDNTVAPGKAELCDGRDNNCDGVTDEDCDATTDPPATDSTCGCASATPPSVTTALLAMAAFGAVRRRRTR